MRILFGTLLAVGLVAGATVGCGGTSKTNVSSPAPGATADDNANGGASYGGSKSSDDPCDAKSDPCGGDE